MANLLYIFKLLLRNDQTSHCRQLMQRCSSHFIAFISDIGQEYALFEGLNRDPDYQQQNLLQPEVINYESCTTET